MLSETQIATDDEESLQELGNMNGNPILNDEPDEESNECHEDRADTEVDADEDYIFPSPYELEQARPPEVGMVFATLEEAHRFLNVYGQVAGFAVKKGRNYKHKKITLQCHKSRKKKEIETQPRKRRRSAIERTGCPMRVTVKLVGGRWEITQVQNEHNHPLLSSPSLTRFFFSHKYMSEDERNLSRILQKRRIKPAEIMDIFSELRGRFKNMPVNNLEQSDSLVKTGNTDIVSTLEHVRRWQKEQPGFYYTIKTDGDNTVRSIFWTDARARLNYASYGDFVCFDTSCRTIGYNMLFALLIGMNGHGKTIVFGWALLEDEKEETFSWLFRRFLDVMDGKKPRMIVTTYSGLSLKKSIEEVFPRVLHRWDTWHMLRNETDKLNGFFTQKSGMEAELTCLVTNSLDPEEFENGWEAMLAKYGTKTNTNLVFLYQARTLWVPVYFKHVFYPFAQSTRCIKSTNSIFKDYVLPNDTIETFISQYDIIQEEAGEEAGDRFDSNLKSPMYITRNPIERHAAEIYTVGMFFRFQKELLDASAFNTFEKEKDVIYTVKKAVEYEEAEFLRDTFSVEVDLKANTFNCICSKFERDGILCCHVLRLFTQFSINKIPEHYINRRWTKKFKQQELEKYCSEKKGSDALHSTSRYTMMMSRMAEICATVSKDPNQSKIFLEEHERTVQKLTGYHADGSNESATT